jgi:hypothetical protein
MAAIGRDASTILPREDAAPRPLFSVTQFCARHPGFPVGGVRWLLFHRETNGLNCAVVKLGRKLLLDENKFFEWVESQQGR